MRSELKMGTIHEEKSFIDLKESDVIKILDKNNLLTSDDLDDIDQILDDLSQAIDLEKLIVEKCKKKTKGSVL